MNLISTTNYQSTLKNKTGLMFKRYKYVYIYIYIYCTLTIKKLLVRVLKINLPKIYFSNKQT